MYESERLLLKHPKMEDWEDMYRNVWCHEETARYMLWDVTTSEEGAIERMRRSIRFQQEHTAWFVYEKATGQAIGFGGFCEVGENTVEDTGVALGPDYVGRGLGTEILTLLMQIAKEEYGAKTFIGTCRKENAASRNLILHCGFRFTHQEDRVDPRNGKPYILEFYERKL